MRRLADSTALSAGATDGESDRPFGDILGSLPLGLAIFDADLRIRFRNQMAEHFLSSGDDLAAAVRELAVESHYEDWAAELSAVLNTGVARRVDVVPPRVGDEPERMLSLSISLIRDGGKPGTGEGAGPFGLLLIEDVTARIGMEKRLAVSERLAAVGKLSARVAHELNNPLDGVLRFTNLALRHVEKRTAGGALDTALARQLTNYLENSRSGLMRMREILAALLEFSRSAPAGFEQATINKIVEDAVAAMEGRARDARVVVACNFLQRDMPVVRGSNMFQVFCNIIKNAIDAMPDGGLLTIETRIDTPNVVVTFDDEGTGLPEDEARIFEPFFTTKPPGQGTGLGLAVCRELIEKYGGAITASRRPTKGTRFCVTIPLKSCAAGAPASVRKRAADAPPDAPREGTREPTPP